MKLNIESGIKKRAIKCVIMGCEGIGKSTLAAKFPEPLFIDTENGTSSLNVRRIICNKSWTDLIEIVNEVIKEPSICKTLVVDTADWAEQLAEEYVCSKNRVASIEAIAYGKGYTYVADEFTILLKLLDKCIDLGLNTVFTAHAKPRKYELPEEQGQFDRWEMKLSRQVAPLLKEWCDMLLFCNYKTYVVTTENNKKKAQGGKRVMYTTHQPTFDAKNRFGLPEELDFDGMSVYATNENYNYSTMALFLYDGQTHYAVICDAEKWISGTQKVGIKTTSTTKHYTNRGLPNKPMIADGINSYNFEACGALISNYAPVYFSWNYIDEKTSYEMASMTLGGGTKYYIPKETRKLNEPIAKIEGTDLIWTAVENATSYGIKIQKNGSTSATNKTTTELSYSLTSIYSSPGLYVVSVRAIGKNIASNWFTINWNYIVELDTPIIELLDTSLSWDYVENSSSYAIYDNGVLWKTTDTEIIDLNKFSLSEGTHKFQVQAISTTDGYADSKLSDSITIVIEKLDAPTITRDEQVILWDEIENAQKYKIYKDTEFISTTKETAFDLSNIDFEAGTYSMSIKATAPLNSDSNFSNSISITMIEAPTLTFSSEGVLSWNNIANATSYNLWTDNELVYSGNLTSHDMTEYVESIQDMHEYRVQAIGNNGLFSSKSTFEIKGDGHSFDTAVAITFGSDGLTIEDEQIDDTNYPIRYYKLKVLESDDYYMYTESSYDTYGELYDSKQNQLDYNDDGGSDSNCCINCSLEVGEVYYLAIRQYSKKTCTFSLHIDTTGPETDDGPFRPEIS